jgi:hypothetical protein
MRCEDELEASAEVTAAIDGWPRMRRAGGRALTPRGCRSKRRASGARCVEIARPRHGTCRLRDPTLVPFLGRGVGAVRRTHIAAGSGGC